MGLKRKIGIGASVILIAVGAFLYDPLPANPSAETLRENAANYSVEIVRDDWGVPHIYGKKDADVSFGLAYAEAEDDFETIQAIVAAARGHLARYQGADAAPTDYIVSLLDVWETVEAHYEEDIPQDVKALAIAYADGLNLYAAKNPSVVWKGLAPFTPEDIVAGFVFKGPFFYGLDTTLMELFDDERAPKYKQELALNTSGNRKAWHVGPKALVARGSNAFAVSGKRSGDGVTRLLINSHQPMTGPVAWYEAHIVSEQGLDMSGATFPGVPIILQGFNNHIGWANTVNAQDLTDVYVLTINPDNKHQYKLDGGWRDFETKTVEIKVKLFGPFVFTSKKKIHRSEHGPVIEAKHGTYALRYAGMGEVRQLEQYYRLNKSESLEAFLKTMAMNALPSINYIYGDKEGNIGYVYNGQYPNRMDEDKAGVDWSKDIPGDRSELIWKGYRPYSDVPKLINPESGFIFNANNTPFSATDGIDNLRAENFPASMGIQTNQTSRSMRIMELSDGVSLIDRQALLDIKFDDKYAQNSEAAKRVANILAIDWSHDSELAKAAKHLSEWDLSTAADSRHAALGTLTVLEMITETFTHTKAPPPEAAFRNAVAYLNTHYGRIDPQWGELNRLTRGDLSLAVDGGPDILRAIYPQEIGDDGKLNAVAGDTWIALVEWDENGDVSADVIHQYGAATLTENSPHYADQAPLFVKKQWRKALLGEKDIRAKASRIYRPQD
ncbi:MAG: hypothetical protein COA43_01320 [Robiginitomaculum sp.]|nr:MAG: hypothetical protein COA43_01320 [Robiginitomaculum sp.]